ncbi:TY1B-A, partial [Symbiodinium necroappetens]
QAVWCGSWCAERSDEFWNWKGREWAQCSFTESSGWRTRDLQVLWVLDMSRRGLNLKEKHLSWRLLCCILEKMAVRGRRALFHSGSEETDAVVAASNEVPMKAAGMPLAIPEGESQFPAGFFKKPIRSHAYRDGPVAECGPEVVRPGVTELVKLPLPTLEGGVAERAEALRQDLEAMDDEAFGLRQRLGTARLRAMQTNTSERPTPQQAIQVEVVALRREQALQLIRELEATTGLRFDDALDALVAGGSYEAALAFSSFVPFLGAVPKQDQEEVASVMCVGVAQGLELVVLEGNRDGLLDPRVWKALSWAAFSGLTSSLQTRVEDDTLLGVMPMWLWTLASIAKKEGEEPTAVKVVEAVESGHTRESESVKPTCVSEEQQLLRAVDEDQRAEGDSGLGLQHRRVKCPTMYALAFDLAGPFKELGRDDRGGKYKYVLVAGLRVPDAALPSPRDDKVDPKVEAQVPGAQVEVRNADEHDDDAASEASWLREQLEPKPSVMRVGEENDSSQEEDAQSDASWFE